MHIQRCIKPDKKWTKEKTLINVKMMRSLISPLNLTTVTL
jgi:hypothetical protein